MLELLVFQEIEINICWGTGGDLGFYTSTLKSWGPVRTLICGLTKENMETVLKHIILHISRFGKPKQLMCLERAGVEKRLTVNVCKFWKGLGAQKTNILQTYFGGSKTVFNLDRFA